MGLLGEKMRVPVDLLPRGKDQENASKKSVKRHFVWLAPQIVPFSWSFRVKSVDVLKRPDH